MPRSKVIIGYSPTLASRRTLVIPEATDPDDFDAVRVPRHVANLRRMGEAVLVAPLGLYRLIGADVILARVLGRPAQSDHHVVVDGRGVVVACVKWDVAIDGPVHPLGAVYHDPQRKFPVGSGYYHAARLSRAA